MNHDVRQFKSLAVALKEMERFVRSGRPLETGKPFENFGGMRPREAWGNWLVCAVMDELNQSSEFAICSDPTGGDGIILDRTTGETWLTEHVMVSRFGVDQTSDAETLILKAIQDKCRKGPTYGRGKTLIVFLNADVGAWSPNSVARRLPDPLHFAAVWVVSLEGVVGGERVYALTDLNLAHGGLHVRISENFDAWTVTPVPRR